MVLVGAVVLAVAWPYDPVADVQPALRDAWPSAAAWLGKDPSGRDVLARCVAGTRAWALPGALASLTTVAAGLALGVGAGWADGPLSILARATVSTVSAIPPFILVLLMVVALGGAPWALGLACGLACAPGAASAVEARILELRLSEFVLAARARGHAELDILVRQVILANTLGPLARAAIEALAFALVAEATLSWFGSFGVQEPAPSWGNMIRYSLASANPLAWLAPVACVWGAAIACAGLARGGARD